MKAFPITLFFSFLLNFSLHAEPLQVAATSDTLPTLSKQNGKYSGIYADIIQALCKELKLEYTITTVPRKRLEKLIQINEFQIGGIMDKNWVQTEKFSWTIPLYPLKTVLLTKKARKLKFHTIEDLNKRYIGCQLGYFYGKTLMEKFAKGEIFRDDAPYLRQNLKRLEFNFIDAVIITQIAAEYILYTNPKYKKIFEVQPMVESTYILSLMCSKEIDIPMEKINKAILKLQQNNTLKDIFKKYGIEMDFTAMQAPK